MQPALLRAYVDETGDRGSSGKSSPFFAFAGVLVTDEAEGALRATMSRLRADLNVSAGRPLHWNEHVKSFSRRQHVTAQLTKLTDLSINYVLVEKNAIPASAAIRNDQEKFYNYAAALMVERVLLAARDWPGGPRQPVIRFGHVRGFHHETTAQYFEHRRATRNPHWLPWHLMPRRVHFDGMASWDGLQAADQYAGMLNAALRVDEFGNHEPHHFLQAVPQLRRSSAGLAWNYGFKFLGNRATLEALPWWGQLAK